LQLAKRLEGLCGFRPYGVIRIAARVADRPGAVEDVARRNRQRPGFVAVEVRQPDPELRVDLAQVGRQRPAQPEGLRRCVAGIAREGERQLALLDLREAVFGKLRRDGDERRAGREDLVVDLG
jgi:hypothetical protein